MKPREYQQRALDQLKQSDHTGLLAMGLGSGKSATACWATQGMGAELVLIIAPIRTQRGWARHVEEILGQELKVLDSKKQGKLNRDAVESGAPGVYFIGWELMRRWYSHKVFDGKAKKEISKSVPVPFNNVEFDLIIADEWHRASNRSSLNFQVVSRIKAKHRLALSATPAGNTPSNIWTALQFLWPNKWGGYWKFCERFFYKEANAFNYTGYTFGAEKRPGMVRRGAPCYVEVSKEEANPELPEVIMETVLVPLNREQRRIYDSWEQQSLAWLDSNPVAIELPMTLDLRLRQATLGQMTVTIDPDTGEQSVDYAEDCKSSKLDALIDILKDIPEDEPVVVWVHSQKFIKAVLYRLRKAGITCAEISGKSKADYKDMIDGKVRVLVAQHEAMSEGVDGLQKVCHIEVWLSLSNTLFINEQATGRLHRQGQTQPVIRYMIQAEDTIDSRVVGRLQKRFDVLKESGLI